MNGLIQRQLGTYSSTTITTLIEITKTKITEKNQLIKKKKLYKYIYYYLLIDIKILIKFIVL